jgi:DNA-binding LytR/AlgR family response regulator
MASVIAPAPDVALLQGIEVVGHRRGSRTLFRVGRIRCFFADGKYTMFRDGHTEYHVNEGIGYLDACLSQRGFLRVSRCALVNAAFVDGLRQDGRFLDFVLDDGSIVRASKRRGRAAMASLVRNRLLLGKDPFKRGTSPFLRQKRRSFGDCP